MSPLIFRHRLDPDTFIPLTGLGILSFTPTDHANTEPYQARLYAAGTSTPLVDSLNLGKPTPTADNLIVVDISAWLNSQTAGNYDVHVAATNASGSSESDTSNSFTVPLFLP